MARESINQAPSVGSTEPSPPRPETEQLQPELRPQELPPEGGLQDVAAGDIDPATVNADDEDDAALPEVTDDGSDVIAEGTLAVGHAAIENAVRLAPTSPGVYRMLSAAHDVLYVGKAKNGRKRPAVY